jgi:hypothetical protein
VSHHPRLADAGLVAVLALAVGIGSVTFAALALAVDLCLKGQNALRNPGSSLKPASK